MSNPETSRDADRRARSRPARGLLVRPRNAIRREESRVCAIENPRRRRFAERSVPVLAMRTLVDRECRAKGDFYVNRRASVSCASRSNDEEQQARTEAATGHRHRWVNSLPLLARLTYPMPNCSSIYDFKTVVLPRVRFMPDTVVSQTSRFVYHRPCETNAGKFLRNECTSYS